MTEVTATSEGREKPQTRRRKSLSDKQLAILEVIQRSIARHGYPPSMREIGDAVGLKSLSSVTHQLNQLELSGYLRRDPGKTRAMEVLIDLPGTSTENPADSAPAVGDAAMVAAGRDASRPGVPITAEQQVEEIFPLPRQLVGKGDLFMLKVSGESMIDARDLRRRLGGRALAARCRQRRHRRGNARRRGETVKTFRRRDGHTWLLPRNSAFEPILGDESVVLGKVVAVLRRRLTRPDSTSASGRRPVHEPSGAATAPLW